MREHFTQVPGEFDFAKSSDGETTEEIQAFLEESVKDVEEAWRMRGEPRQGDWRCPGCQSKRTAIPASYW